MSIKGNLREASLPDVIQLLSLGKKTGVLSISDKKNFGDIFFENGKIIYCSIVNRENRIGQILLNHSDIDKNTLQIALEKQSDMRGKRRLGDILVEMGAVSEKTLYKRIRQQIYDTMFTFLTWEDGFFNFEPGLKPDDEIITVSLNADDILLEQARKVDEWGLIEKDIPSENTIIMKTNFQKTDNLNRDEHYIFSIINNRLTLKELYDKSTLGKYETAKAIYNLKKSGYLYWGEEKDISVQINNKQKIDEHYNLGLAFLLTEMYEEALREFKYIIQIDKTNAMANFNIGLIYYRMKDYKTALKYFEEILKLGYVNEALYNNLALVLEKMKEYDRAEEYYEKAVQLYPEDAKLLANYGILAYFQHLLYDAEERLTMALNIEPKMNYARFYLALVYLESGKINESIDQFLIVTKQDPEIWQVYYNIANIYKHLEKYDSAEHMFKKALQVSRGHKQCYRALIELYYMQKNFVLAEAILLEVVSKYKDEFDFYYKIGNLKFKKGEREKAIEYWEKALSLNPEHKILRKTLETVKNG